MTNSQPPQPPNNGGSEDVGGHPHPPAATGHPPQPPNPGGSREVGGHPQPPGQPENPDEVRVRSLIAADVPALLGLIDALADYEHLPRPDAAARKRLA